VRDIDKNELIKRLNRTITFIDKNIARSFASIEKIRKELEDTVRWVEGSDVSALVANLPLDLPPIPNIQRAVFGIAPNHDVQKTNLQDGFDKLNGFKEVE